MDSSVVDRFVFGRLVAPLIVVDRAIVGAFVLLHLVTVATTTTTVIAAAAATTTVVFGFCFCFRGFARCSVERGYGFTACVCMRACLCVCTGACVRVCMCVCTHVCMCVCMYMCVCMRV